MGVTVLALLLSTAQAGAPATEACTLHIGSSTGRHVPRPSLGCHLDAGYAHQTKALSAEMVYGSAFGAMPDPPGPNATRAGGASFAFCAGPDASVLAGLPTSAVGLPSTASLLLTPSGADGPKLLRHCDSQLYATKFGDEPRPHPGDYVWQLRPAASHPGAITLHPSDAEKSAGIGLIKGEETGRLGFGTDVIPLLFMPVAGLANASQTSFRDVASGGFLTLSAELRGNCARRNGYGNGDGDAVLSNGTDAARATWALVSPRPPTPPHPGPRPPAPSPNVCTGWLGVGGAVLDPTKSLIANGTSMVLPPSTAGKLSAIINRGFAGEGLYLQADKPYNGFILVLASVPAVINATLRTTTGTVLGSASMRVAATPRSEWVKVNFSITPHQGTKCIGISQETADAAGVACPVGNKYRGSINPAAHICVDCGGELVLSQTGGTASVHLGYASLQPGSWGKYKGLPVNKYVAESLEDMGLQMIREGGSFLDHSSTNGRWEYWRGPVWLRPASIDGSWRHAAMAPWGFFEFIDLATALGIPSVVSTFAEVEPQEYANLVEYCFGNESTPFGKLRHVDGHPAVFNVTYFELGNEQQNADFVSQVTAMEAKAASLGMAKTLKYVYPTNHAPNLPTPAVGTAMAELGIGQNAVMDWHCNYKLAPDCLSEIYAVLNQSEFATWGAIIEETNLATHDIIRALDEGQAFNQFSNVPAVYTGGQSRLQGRAASFCLERSGYNEGGLNDQGLIFFLPNQTFTQPPGLVHKMIADTWQPIAADVSLVGPGCASAFPPPGPDFTTRGPAGTMVNVGRESEGAIASAQVSADGTAKSVRFVNRGDTPIALTLASSDDLSASMGSWQVSAITGAPNQTNTPSEPQAVAPTMPRPLKPGETFVALPHSFTVFTLST